MRKVPLDLLASLCQQPLASFALDAPPICIDRCLLGRLALPFPRPSFRFGDVAAYLKIAQLPHRFVTVVSLVRDDFLNAFRRNCRFVEQLANRHARLTYGLM